MKFSYGGRPAPGAEGDIFVFVIFYDKTCSYSTAPRRLVASVLICHKGTSLGDLKLKSTVLELGFQELFGFDRR